MNYEKLLRNKQFIYHVNIWKLKSELGLLENQTVTVRNYRFEVMGKGLIVRRGPRLHFSGAMRDFLKRIPDGV